MPYGSSFKSKVAVGALQRTIPTEYSSPIKTDANCGRLNNQRVVFSITTNDCANLARLSDNPDRLKLTEKKSYFNSILLVRNFIFRSGGKAPAGGSGLKSVPRERTSLPAGEITKSISTSGAGSEVGGAVICSQLEIYNEAIKELEKKNKLIFTVGRPGVIKNSVGSKELQALLNDINDGCLIGEKIKSMIGSTRDYNEVSKLLEKLKDHAWSDLPWSVAKDDISMFTNKNKGI
jgi:hypothetical protein